MNLEPKHNQAIRDEMGDRLRVLLSREPPAVSARLRTLLRRFDEADHGSPAFPGVGTQVAGSAGAALNSARA